MWLSTALISSIITELQMGSPSKIVLFLIYWLICQIYLSKSLDCFTSTRVRPFTNRHSSHTLRVSHFYMCLIHTQFTEINVLMQSNLQKYFVDSSFLVVILSDSLISPFVLLDQKSISPFILINHNPSLSLIGCQVSLVKPKVGARWHVNSDFPNFVINFWHEMYSVKWCLTFGVNILFDCLISITLLSIWQMLVVNINSRIFRDYYYYFLSTLILVPGEKLKQTFCSTFGLRRLCTFYFCFFLTIPFILWPLWYTVLWYWMHNINTVDGLKCWCFVFSFVHLKFYIF